VKAVRIHEYGQRPVVDQVPEPEIGGSQDVIVRIAGAGLCRTDLHIIEGLWAEAMAPELPYILGHENAGWVESVGSGVEHLKPGDPVIVHPLGTCGVCAACRSGNDMHCESSVFPGASHDGGMAEMLKVTARSVLRLPEGADPKEVAAHADAGLTAYHAIKKLNPVLTAQSTVAVIGAGGLGHIGIQILRALTPARVIVIDSSSEALNVATELGAHETLLAKGGQVDALLGLTDGRGAEAVLDFVGEGGAEQEAIDMVRNGGTYSVVGYGGTLSVPTIELIAREIKIEGNLVGTFSDLDELMALVATGRVNLRTSIYPLEAIDDAIDDLERGRIRGRAILVP
jgi:NAD+-dependent secondary alcohol dehydrogenase Adh1